ncbi:MAG: type IV pilus modification PilV family protein [Aeromonadaceae bacterium]
MLAKARGFTLMELVITLVLLSIVLVPMVGLLVDQSRKALDPVQEVRASQLAQRLFNQMLSRAYDQNSDLNGSRWRCGEVLNGVTYPTCTASAGYGPDSGETRAYLFNDVDDFDTAAICNKGLTSCDSGNWVRASFFTQDSSGEASEYAGFSVHIAVTAVAGCAANCAQAKHVLLQIRLPAGGTLPFAFERGNY